MKTYCLYIVLAFISACGVKGDPVPPQVPPPIGRGKPSYSKATMSLPEQKRQMPKESDWVDEDDKKDEVKETEEGEYNEN